MSSWGDSLQNASPYALKMRRTCKLYALSRRDRFSDHVVSKPARQQDKLLAYPAAEALCLWQARFVRERSESSRCYALGRSTEVRWAFPFLPLLHEDPPDVQRRDIVPAAQRFAPGS